MFSLEQTITAWRKQMLAAGIQTPVPLEELEAHLREEIEQRQQSGMSEQSAFESAAQQIGSANPLNQEFAKVATSRDARQWKLQQIAFTAGATLFPLWLTAMVFFKVGGFTKLTSGERLSGLAAVAVFALLFWGGRLGYRMLPVIPSKRIRDAITCACFALVALWWIVSLRIIAPHYDFTVGQFVVVFLWGFLTPAGIFAGLAWGLETAAWKKARQS
jgi:hypothetical protein